MRTAVLVMVVAAVALTGCRDAEEVTVLTGEAMGTSYRIKCVNGENFDASAIGRLCDRLDLELSTWREDSWVARFNAAPAGTTMTMPDNVRKLLALGRELRDETGGRFDPTVGALVRLWGFGAWRDEWKGEPTDGEIEAARGVTGFQLMRIEGDRVTKLDGGLMLDFSGIAKGYAVDRMSDLLEEGGYGDFVVEFGGEVFARGFAPGKDGWIIGGPALDAPILLKDEAVASSGSEHQHRGGLSHVIDPRTGRPVAVGTPVSVRAETCARADALATAALVEAAE